MILNEERINSNKQEFIGLLKSIKREGALIDKLINKLESSDFFEAPASAKNHLACKGGLVEHCLNVYYNLKHLVLYKKLEIPEESIIITALLHDFSKMNVYELAVTNKKVYSEQGTKSDNLGKFDWIAETSYKRKEEAKTFIFGNHEQTSEYMVRQFIPLTIIESIAILHHMGGQGFDCAKDNLSLIYTKYPLACLLHLADMMATFVDEA